MHPPAQSTRELVHVSEQAPAEHTCPAGHVVPQLPQFTLSVVVFAQYGAPASAPHVVSDPEHVFAHTPAEQTWPDAHAFAHEPQWPVSEAVLTQLEPHCVVPPPQSSAQVPSEQTLPTGQTTLQLPQWVGSLAVLTQLPPHDSRPRGQTEASLAVESAPPAVASIVASFAASEEPASPCPAEESSELQPATANRTPITTPNRHARTSDDSHDIVAPSCLTLVTTTGSPLSDLVLIYARDSKGRAAVALPEPQPH